MRLDQSVIGEHPAKSGYFLEFIAEDFYATSFQDGSGKFFVNSPDFAITGLNIKDKSALYEPVDFLTDLDVFEDQIELECFFSGEFGGSGKSNIFYIDVYTGGAASFAPNFATLENRVTRKSVEVSNDTESLSIVVSADEIGEINLDQNIYYKAVPADYLASRGSSEGIGATMLPEIEVPTQIIESRVDILRSNALDFLYSERGDEGLDIFNECLLTFDSGIAKDADMTFRIRTNTEEITLSGIGLPFQLEDSFKTFFESLNGNTGTDFVIFPTGREFSEFSVKILLDQAEDRQFFYLY
jgi:hypothetical protein